MIEMINKKEDIFGDNIASVEQWDFSRANLNQENRIRAITLIASVCYQNPKALNSESLYNRLAAESMGLPSSSFEMVPVLIPESEYWDRVDTKLPDWRTNNPLEKYGEWIDDSKYLLTNYRAVVYLYESYGVDLRDFFNTKEECKIIARHFKVYKFKVDFPTRSQMVRHRVNWQELSRRYVSGKRVPFEFYISEKMAEVESYFHWTDNETSIYDTKEVLDICLNHYYKALENGIKPQEARRIIPQAAYTQIWGAFQPTQYENFMKLRDDEVHAQWEIAQVAKAMKELTNEN